MPIYNLSIKNKVFNPKYKVTEVSKLLNSGYTQVRSINQNVKSINFTREAFSKNIWNNETIKARGLFVDNKENVVARGFEKFFNLNQTEDTDEQNILEKLNKAIKNNDKIKIAEKLDGFLTIISYSPETNGLFITSKGGGIEYSKVARRTLLKKLEQKHLGKFNLMEYLNNFLKDEYEKGNKYSIIMETINPRYDFHLIKYNEAHSVCLTVVDNQLNYIGRDDIYKEIVEKFKLETPNILDYKSLLDNGKFTHESIEKMQQEQDIEGYVIYINDKPLVKIKTYKFLKRKEFRSVLMRYLRIVKLYYDVPDKFHQEEFDFLNKLQNNQVKKALEKIINTKLILNTPNIPEANGWQVDIKSAINIPQLIEKYQLNL